MKLASQREVVPEGPVQSHTKDLADMSGEQETYIIFVGWRKRLTYLLSRVIPTFVINYTLIDRKFFAYDVCMAITFRRVSIDRYGCQSCLWPAEQEKIFLPFPCSRLRISSRETGSADPSLVSSLILHPQGESGAYLWDSSRFLRPHPHIPPTAIGSVAS